MIKTISKIIVHASNIKVFIDIFKQMVEPTKTEKGYIEYEMYQDKNSDNTLVVLEKWETQEDFNNHLKSDHFNKFVPSLKELMIKETDFSLCERIA